MNTRDMVLMIARYVDAALTCDKLAERIVGEHAAYLPMISSPEEIAEALDLSAGAMIKAEHWNRPTPHEVMSARFVATRLVGVVQWMSPPRSPNPAIVQIVVRSFLRQLELAASTLELRRDAARHRAAEARIEQELAETRTLLQQSEAARAQADHELKAARLDQLFASLRDIAGSQISFDLGPFNKKLSRALN